MKKKTALQFVAMLAIAGAFLSAGGVYLWVMQSKQEIVVPVVAQDVKRGTKILETDVATVKINPNALTPQMVSNPLNVIGNYSLRDIKSGEYFYANWISTSFAKRLAERVVYCAVPAPTSQILSVNGEIKENDFVMITIITSTDASSVNLTNVDGVPAAKTKLIEPPELSAVRVLGIYDGSGIDINEKKDLLKAPDDSVDPNTQLPQGSFIVFDCNEIQRAMILQAQYSGAMQIIILPEEEQQQHRIAWGLVEPEEGEDYPVSNVPSSSQMTPEEIEERRQQLIDVSDQEVKTNIDAAAKEQGIELTPTEQADIKAGQPVDQQG